MKALVLTVLAATAASAFADDGWVSVGAAKAVAPAVPSASVDTSSQAVIAPSARTVSSAGASSGLVSELYLQMEQMQQEIAMLRDQVEAQNHQISRMKQEQQDRYLDLDRRLSAMMNAAPVPNTAAAGSDTAPVMSAADAYKQAQKLMYEKKYQEANEAYLAMAKQYPQEPLAVNALYWSGEIYLLQGELEKALASFRQVVDNHADHQKVPDATYKVGYTLDKQGKTADARVWMKKVVDQFTGKADTAVRLAKNYLDSH